MSLHHKIFEIKFFFQANNFDLSLGISTFESNQDRDRDVLICQDRFLKPVAIFLTVEIESLKQDLNKNRDFKA